MVKYISILGSTGSIGTSALDVVSAHPEHFKIVGLTANYNIELLEQQIKTFQPRIVSVATKELADTLRTRISTNTKITYGTDGLIAVATHPNSNLVLSSVVGVSGLLPTIEALKAKKDIAIANKETLVAAGHIVTELAKQNGCRLIPVDSEHSAIFQCLNGENNKEIDKLIVTASGGAFRDKTREEMKTLQAKDALKHPNWLMGAKLTIDSATLMNKGFEVMEARWLFDIPYEKIDVMIHKESIIHSLVEFIDGSVIAQLGAPDMRMPIQYAFHYPTRLPSSYEKLNLLEIGSLHFEKPDLEKFPCLQYAYECGKIGGTTPAVLNAANEIANALFLKNEIAFFDIEKTIYKTVEAHHNVKDPSLDAILEADQWARQYANQLLIKKS
ncbi:MULTISPECIES: 1-deoxy-D-xylulose-5-phosphate reductoisomerase [Bacillus]|uniref:1-deoxy-D-xylulose 5-phosphate reductoisomerase 1 n=1 Tax=Bacillus thuringiensis subsp. konkukian (strain 97-27) TaxID=281309 RepID=DXR1_BACHK|nr:MULTISPECIES: 1-deoxy-D-xylulose-5-phosphate reductoisomerase [Bacillus]Q6HG59.1 RecName: Full=1-deoxy-D-xylulose 5-phosphate reductoisomerase 1; Short=DXP reductoisomerase 1; AltName: Full=1-deoxyxylulose-5-phosphate reductoisomerase 1; AltName: Full=2-C-methyl-D-erythritol 4-phosphate synthase 1 [[Bacillus thuringiensis] serovar konkukian str. 97-27]AAT62181.1 1-deoxy-D-xylulose 5-phosphate reductoisomerase [[Bacillus thuringiensis] serovar konkukian str. 97-27]AJI36407.1 1-deoxy-D-xylulose